MLLRFLQLSDIMFWLKGGPSGHTERRELRKSELWGMPEHTAQRETVSLHDPALI